MILELGNHAAKGEAFDDRPKVTTIHIPEADEAGIGGYTHDVGGITVAEFKDHLMDSVLMRQGITQLPGHEVLLSILHPGEGAWGRHGEGLPAWVRATDHELTPTDRSADIEGFLQEYWGCPSAEKFFGSKDYDEQQVKKELQYWTRTPPGEMPQGLSLPDATAGFTNNGRVISNVNDGGGQVGATGQASASSGTTLTTGSTYTTNQWAGYRVYASVNATTMVWGNVVSNTNAASASVLTVDRWYTAATPGGAAGSTPSATATFIIADGGFVSTWFVGLATGANATAATDTSLSTNGNAEIATAGGGLIRKIAPYAQTSGVATRSITLTPVYTANGSDSLPAVVTTMGAFCSMVVGTAGTMKFETTLNASATMAAIGDQLTITETINGS